MKTLFVGDIHGEWEVVKKVLKFPGRVVFVGDYVDSHTRSTDSCIKALKLVLDAVENRPLTIAHFGNHEMSYCGHMCSGYNWDTQITIDSELRHKMDAYLKYYSYVDGVLVSHAGVSSKYLEANNVSLDDYLKTGEYTEVGYTRGGRNPVGGLLWCDWFTEFEPIQGVPQICGHSGYRPSGVERGILKNDNTYMIDNFCCGGKEVLLMTEDKTFKVINLRDIHCFEGL